MAKLKIRVSKRHPYRTYLPKEIGEEGFVGEVEGIADAFTFTLIKPGVSLKEVRKSLKVVLKDIELRINERKGEED